MSIEYIYIKGNHPKNAFLLTEGELTNIVIDQYTFNINTKPFFFGVSELLIKEADGNCPFFFSTNITENNSKFKTVSLDDLKLMFKESDKGLKIIKDIAFVLIQLDKIYLDMKKSESDKQKIGQRHAKLFCETIDELGELLKEKKILALENLYNEGLTSISYTKGKAFKDLYSGTKFKMESSFFQLDEYTKKFPRGAFICQQGEAGDELYIFKQGLVKVYIDDIPISLIDKPGTIIGEMMFFSDGKRKASLQAVKNTVLTVIKKSDLIKILKSNPNFLYSIALNISRHIVSVIQAIEELKSKESIVDNDSEKERSELRELRNKLSDLYLKFDEFSWLNESSKKITEHLGSDEKEAV